MSEGQDLDREQPAVGLSVLSHKPAIPRLAIGEISSHKTQKEWHQSHFNGSWIIVPSFLHPTEPKRWVVGSAAVSRNCLRLPLWPLLLPVGRLSMIATNQRARPCCVMLLTGLNFVKLVTNLNSCSLRALIITLRAVRNQLCPLQVDEQEQKHSPTSHW